MASTSVKKHNPVSYLQLSSNSSTSSSKRKITGWRSENSSGDEEYITKTQSDISSTEISDSRQADDRRGSLKNFETKLLVLQERCETLEQHNKEMESKNMKKVTNLRRRNAELANIARKLESKAKALQEQLNQKSQTTVSEKELSQQKKVFHKIKCRMETEHTRDLAQREYQIKNLRSQLEDLKRALRQANSIKQSKIRKTGDDEYMTSNTVKTLRQENMRLHRLVTAGSKKVIVRSLSTPVTARQKILEETNRNLRRQVASFEEDLRNLNNGESFGDVKEELEDYRNKYNELLRNNKDYEIARIALESQLQMSKIEASDLSLKLKDKEEFYEQLQVEYKTVHEQLSEVIDARDKAVEKCNLSYEEIKSMEKNIRSLEENHAETLQHEKKAAKEFSVKTEEEYNKTFKELQDKINELEKECKKHRKENEVLREKVSSIMGNKNDFDNDDIDLINDDLVIKGKLSSSFI